MAQVTDEVSLAVDKIAKTMEELGKMIAAQIESQNSMLLSMLGRSQGDSTERTNESNPHHRGRGLTELPAGGAGRADGHRSDDNSRGLAETAVGQMKRRASDVDGEQRSKRTKGGSDDVGPV